MSTRRISNSAAGSMEWDDFVSNRSFESESAAVPPPGPMFVSPMGVILFFAAPWLADEPMSMPGSMPAIDISIASLSEECDEDEEEVTPPQSTCNWCSQQERSQADPEVEVAIMRDNNAASMLVIERIVQKSYHTCIFEKGRRFAGLACA